MKYFIQWQTCHDSHDPSSPRNACRASRNRFIPATTRRSTAESSLTVADLVSLIFKNLLRQKHRGYWGSPDVEFHVLPPPNFFRAPVVNSAPGNEQRRVAEAKDEHDRQEKSFR